MRDRFHCLVVEQSNVKLLRADPSLLSGLPNEDVAAIKRAVCDGITMQVTELCPPSQVWLDFEDGNNSYHSILVDVRDTSVI